MNKYIGTKLIEAEKATLAEAQALKTGACDTIEEARERFGGSDDGNPRTSSVEEFSFEWGTGRVKVSFIVYSVDGEPFTVDSIIEV